MFRFLNCTEFVTNRFKNEVVIFQAFPVVTSIILLRIINVKIY